MVQPDQRTRKPLSAVIAAILLLISIVGAFWVPFYNRPTPKLGDFPFFYWYQLIWMPVTMVLCYLAYLLIRRRPEPAGAASPAEASGTTGEEAK
jgi:Protein of unknown function (DUF3311)